MTMTPEEIKEAEKYWRLSVHFLYWVFIVYGNWKRRILRMPGKPGFKVYDFHPFKPKKAVEL